MAKVRISESLLLEILTRLDGQPESAVEPSQTRE